PVGAHRLQGTARPLQSRCFIECFSPGFTSEDCHHASSSSSALSEALALEALALLENVQLPLSRAAGVNLLDSLYVLTMPGPSSASEARPEALSRRSLLDVAVEGRVRIAIPLLRLRKMHLELLDVLSFEDVIRVDDEDGVAAYLEAGMCPDCRANAGRPVLMVAAAVKAGKVLQLLLAHGANVHQRSGFGGWTGLMWAAHVGWLEGCQAMLAAGACCADLNDQGVAAAQVAARQGHTEVAIFLAANL
ncbi:unnamed protein product, partial [Polarella glacialis]